MARNVPDTGQRSLKLQINVRKLESLWWIDAQFQKYK